LLRSRPAAAARPWRSRSPPTPRFQTDGLLAHLLKQANSQHPPTWFAPWLKAEREATWLRTSHPGLVPGLLQTEAYARALFSAGGQYEPDEEEELIAERLERQTMLTGERPKRLIAVLDELALRRIIGGREVAEEQLRHLLDMAQRPNVTLHVIPADAGAYPGIGGGFILATMPEGDVVVYLENAAVGELMDRPETVDMMQRKWDSLLGRAMPEQISLAIIEKLMGEL
jgi:hypothetical protein